MKRGTNKKSSDKAASGLAAVMDDLRAQLGSPPDVARAQQLPLIPTRGAAGADPGAAPAAADGGGEGKRGPGRPPGSTNETTREWRDYILARYPSPLIGLAEICGRPTLLLARELSCAALDALKAQMRAMEILAKYTHSAMPVAVEVEAKGQVPIIFNISPHLGDLINAAGGDMGNRGPFKVIDQKAGTSITYGPSPDEVGQDDVGQ